MNGGEIDEMKKTKEIEWGKGGEGKTARRSNLIMENEGRVGASEGRLGQLRQKIRCIHIFATKNIEEGGEM